MGREREVGETAGNSTDDSSQKRDQDAPSTTSNSVKSTTGNVPTENKQGREKVEMTI